MALQEIDKMHEVITLGIWEFQLWPFKVRDPLRELENLEIEYRNNPHSTMQPPPTVKTLNIITEAGLNEFAKRDARQSTKQNTHHAIGTGTNREKLQDTALQTQVARKTIGTTTRQGSETTYKTAFTNSDFTATSHNIREAGVFTAATGGVCMMRATTKTDLLLNDGSTLSVSSTISRRNAIA